MSVAALSPVEGRPRDSADGRRKPCPVRRQRSLPRSSAQSYAGTRPFPRPPLIRRPLWMVLQRPQEIKASAEGHL